MRIVFRSPLVFVAVELPIWKSIKEVVLKLGYEVLYDGQFRLYQSITLIYLLPCSQNRLETISVIDRRLDSAFLSRTCDDAC